MSAERKDDIVQAALELLEEEGADALTMRRLADRLGVKAPSLYKHLAGKDDLEAALIAVGLEQVASAFAHGMVHLELSERFPPDADLDAAWRDGIAALGAAPSLTTTPARTVVRSWRGPD